MFYLTSFIHFLFPFILLFNLNCLADLSQETIYLTWQQSPSTTMTIQWISSPKENQSVIVYRKLGGESEWQKATGEVINFPHASYLVIHTVELKNLQPNSEYAFKVSPSPLEYRFLTAPNNLEKEVRFVVGGDMYHDDISFLIKTNQQAAKTNPLFALIGGDIAYAVKSSSFGMQQINRWIDWIKAWHTHMVTPQGHLIPVISAIGNHDLNGGFDQTPAQAAIFSALFPMPGKQVYNVLDFDPFLSIFILDSGHSNPIGGKQTEWLKKALSEHTHAAWADWSAAFVLNFSPRLHFGEWHRLVAERRQQPNESGIEYALDKYKLLRVSPIPLNDEQRVSFLIDGLAKWQHVAAMTANAPANVTAFIQRIRALETLGVTGRPDAQPPGPVAQQTVPDFGAALTALGDRLVEQMMSRLSIGNRGGGRGGSSRGRGWVDPGARSCYNCGVVGHMSRNCPSKHPKGPAGP